MFNRLYLSVPLARWTPVQPATIWSNLGSVHQVPITGGLTRAVWNTKFARHFCTWAVHWIESQTFWSWGQCAVNLVFLICVSHDAWIHVFMTMVIESAFMHKIANRQTNAALKIAFLDEGNSSSITISHLVASNMNRWCKHWTLFSTDVK